MEGLEELVNSLTTKEIAKVEQKAGVPFDALENPEALGKISLMCGLAWIIQVKNGGSATFDEYANRPFTEVMKELGVDDE